MKGSIIINLLFLLVFLNFDESFAQIDSEVILDNLDMIAGGENLRQIEFSHDGKYLIIAFETKIKIYDPGIKQVINEFPFIKSRPKGYSEPIIGKTVFFVHPEKHHLTFLTEKHRNLKDGMFNSYWDIVNSIQTINYIENTNVHNYTCDTATYSIIGRDVDDSTMISLAYLMTSNHDMLVYHLMDSIMLYDPEMNVMVYRKGFDKDVQGIAIFSDNRIAVGHNDSLTILYPADTNKIDCYTVDGLENIFIPNDSLILTLNSDMLTSWEIVNDKLVKGESKKFISGITNVFQNHSGDMITYTCERYGIEKHRSVFLFDNNFRKIGEILINRITGVGAFHPTRNVLLLQGRGNSMELYDLESYTDEARFVPQLNNTEEIESIDVSYDKKYMITGSRSKLFIWDMKLGKIIFTFNTDYLEYAYFIENSYDIILQTIFTDTRPPFLIRWNNWIHNYETTLPLKNDNDIDLSELVRDPPLNTFKSWRRELGRYKPEKPYQIDESHSWKTAVVDGEFIYKKIIINGTGKYAGIHHIIEADADIRFQKAVHIIDENSIAVAGKDCIYIIDPHKGEIVRTIRSGIPDISIGPYYEGISRLVFSDYNNLLASYYNENLISLWDLEEGLLKTNHTNNVNILGNDRRFDFCYPYLTSLFRNEPLDVQIVYENDPSNNTWKNEVYGLNVNEFDSIVSYKSGKIQFINKISFFDAVRIRPGTSELVLTLPVIENSNGQLSSDKQKFGSELLIWDFERMKIINSFQMPELNGASYIDINSTGTHALVWENNSSSKEMHDPQDNSSTSPQSSKFFLVNLDNGEIRDYSLDKLKINRISENDLKFIRDYPTRFCVRDEYKSQLYFFDIQKKKPEDWMNGYPASYGLENYKESGLIKSPYSISNDGEIIFFAKGSNLFPHQKNYRGIRKNDLSPVFNIYTKYDIHSSSYFSKKKWIALGFRENIIQLVNAENGDEIGQLINYGGGFFLTPEGYYRGSRTGIRNVYFRYRDKLFTYEQFDLKYNRPDIILEKLGFVSDDVIKAYYQAYQKRINKLGFTEEMLGSDFHIPEILLVNMDEFPDQPEDGMLNVKVKATDNKYNLRSINIWVNNVALYGLKGYEIAGEQLNEIDMDFDIPLSNGENKIQFSCLNSKGAESHRETFYINHKPSKHTDTSMYIICISVSDYLFDKMDLKYAVDDGRDIIDQYLSNGKQWENINVDSLFDYKATRENILALKKKLLNTKIDDQVILFVSGHGLLDENFDFYFATHDIDFNNPSERGVSYDQLEWLLDSIPARKKLFLMDACHSGEVDKDELIAQKGKSKKGAKSGVTEYTYRVGSLDYDIPEGHLGLQNSFELMQELFTNLNRGSGTVVVSAAAGNSYAMESDEWQNGVFTYSILNGIRSMDADLNGDGEITVSELRVYVSESVQDLTGGLQKPTVRQENIEFDFRVW